MNMTAGFYFLILLLGLILFSFLGGYKEGMFGVDSGNTNSNAYFTPEPANTFTGANQNNKGAIAYYSNNGDGTYTVVKVDTYGQVSAYNASKKITDNKIITQVENSVSPGSPNMEMFASSAGYLNIIHANPGSDYVLISNIKDSSLPSGYIGALTATKAPTITTSQGTAQGTAQGTSQGSVTFGTSITGPAAAATSMSTPTNPGVVPIMVSGAYSQNINLANQRNSQNYNHYTGTSMPTKFYGNIQGKAVTATIIATGNGSTISITADGISGPHTFIPAMSDNDGNILFIDSTDSNNSETLKMTSDSNGNPILQLCDEKGVAIPDLVLTPYQNNTMNTTLVTNTVNTPQQPANAGAYSSPGASNTSTSPSFFGWNFPTSFFSNVNGPSLPYILGPTPPANVTSQNSNGQYNSWLPGGIPASMIPPGDEDLYILKSSVVPPVCPSCPAPIVSNSTATSSSSSSNTDTSSCPACPACARCPEPAFTCQKVPNYAQGSNNSSLPKPMTGSNYSTYGM